MAAATDLYLPDECWECVFKFLNNGIFKFIINDNYNRLSLVSKQFLSITNRLIFSLTINNPTHHCLSRLFQRFPNLNSLNFPRFLLCSKGFCRVSSLASSLVTDLVVFPQLKSLYLANHSCLRDQSIKNFASIFPNLQLLDLSCCRNITEVHICQILSRCSNIRHLNLTNSLGLKLRVMNFNVPNLEVLYLSHTRVDDEALYVISKSCSGLLQLYLENCYCVTTEGVKHVVENCTQLREINLRCCQQVHGDVLASLIFSRPSLRKLTTPDCYRFSDREIELLARQGCIIC